MTLVADYALTYKIIGCAIAVHNQLGPGLKEGIYQRALAVEFDKAGLRHQEEKSVEIFIDGVRVGLLYLDHLVNEACVVEIKALKHPLTDDEIGQTITYLVATGHAVGLLINFGRQYLDYRRILPPRKIELWRDRINRYVWNPPSS